MKENKNINLLIILLIINLIDVITTLVILGLGGSEANSIMNWFLQKGGIAFFLFIKVFIIILFIIIMELASKKIFQKKIRNYYIITIVAYISIWAVGFLKTNFF